MASEVSVKKELIEREEKERTVRYEHKHQPAVVNDPMMMIDLTGEPDSSDDDDVELVSVQFALPGRRQSDVKDVKVEQKPPINLVPMTPRNFQPTPNAPPMQTSVIMNALQSTVHALQGTMQSTVTALQGTMQSAMQATVQQIPVSSHHGGVNVQASFHFTQVVQPPQQQRKRRRKRNKKRGGPLPVAVDFRPMHQAQGFQGNVRRIQEPLINQAIVGIKIEAPPSIKREFPVPTLQKVSTKKVVKTEVKKKLPSHM